MRRLLLLLSALLSVNYLFAQPTAIQYDIPSCTASTYEQTIGKVSSDNVHIISCHKHTNNSDFVFSDEISTDAYIFDLPTGMYVSDMEILDGVVYFCGSYTNQGLSYGVVGYFSETDFVGSAASITYATFVNYTFFDKMEVYRDDLDNSIHLAVICHNYVSSFSFNTGLLLMNLNGGAISYYDISLLGNTQYFTDVAITDNYIISVGSSGCVGGNSMSLCIIKKIDLLHFYPYVVNEVSGEANSCFYNITELADDYVALSTTIYSPSDSKFYTRIHTFNISTNQFVVTQDIPIANKNMENEMLYFKEDGTLLVLQTNCYPNNNSPYESIIYKLKAFTNATYYVDLLYDQNAYYNSLDRYQGNKQFIATGELKTTGHTFFKRNIDASYNSQCFSANTEKVIITPSPTVPATNPQINQEFLQTTNTMSQTIYKEKIVPRCFENKNRK